MSDREENQEGGEPERKDRKKTNDRSAHHFSGYCDPQKMRRALARSERSRKKLQGAIPFFQRKLESLKQTRAFKGNSRDVVPDTSDDESISDLSDLEDVSEEQLLLRNEKRQVLSANLARGYLYG